MRLDNHEIHMAIMRGAVPAAMITASLTTMMLALQNFSLLLNEEMQHILMVHFALVATNLLVGGFCVSEAVRHALQGRQNPGQMNTMWKMMVHVVFVTALIALMAAIRANTLASIERVRA
jgi:hypothetical protein